MVAPAFPPTAIGIAVWIVFTVMAVIFVISENIRPRLLSLPLAFTSFALGLTEHLYVWVLDNGTLVTSSIFTFPPDGVIYYPILVLEIGLVLMSIGSIIDWALHRGETED